MSNSHWYLSTENDEGHDTQRNQRRFPATRKIVPETKERHGDVYQGTQVRIIIVWLAISLIAIWRTRWSPISHHSRKEKQNSIQEERNSFLPGFPGAESETLQL